MRRRELPTDKKRCPHTVYSEIICAQSKNLASQ
jgi:hypothetical protein